MAGVIDSSLYARSCRVDTVNLELIAHNASSIP